MTTFNLKSYLKACLSFRYLSNFAIITSIIAYYTNATSVFFITIPIVIANLILILLIQFYDYDELIAGIFNNSILDKDSKTTFFIINTIWHIWPLLWLYRIINNDNIIRIYKPNFINIFFQCLIIVLPYFYYSSTMKIYGNINYICYSGIYISVLFILCYSLYNY